MTAKTVIHPLPDTLPATSWSRLSANSQFGALLPELLHTGVIQAREWAALDALAREELMRQADRGQLLGQLVAHGLLTVYQAERIGAGKTFGLIVGNYRVLDRLGTGAMGVVFKGEHLYLHQPVAIKVLPVARDQKPLVLERFFTEMRTVAQLDHPNIVSALDAGAWTDADPDAPVLHYLVMEYIPGQDLEELVQTKGALEVATACDLAYQVAGALAEAHRHDLIHRDIKPSNILVSPDGQAKLLDFGLARHFRQRLTEPGTLLGTIDYVAPEQARDAGSVDIRADLYGLGGVLFWSLTGTAPFPRQDNLVQDLTYRLTHPPPYLRLPRPEIPAELDALVSRLLALNPDERFPTPAAIMRGLLPFLKRQTRRGLPPWESAAGAAPAPAIPSGVPEVLRSPRILIVDDERVVRAFCRFVLQAEGMGCTEAENGFRALEAIAAQAPDLVLTDMEMPELSGLDLLHHLRRQPPCPHLKIITMSGRATADEMAQLLQAGTDDYLTKPLSAVQLRARVQSALNLKEAQDRSDQLNRHLLAVNAELEWNLNARDGDLVHARNALVLALAKLVEHRSTETQGHLQRLQRYCRCLAEEAAALPLFAGQIHADFIAMLECWAPLHDIGKVGLPDHILMKAGQLQPDERIIMQSHTLLGAETLREVAQRHGRGLVFLPMAIDIARHHHEHFDGSGYPDHLAGEAIPLAARLVAIGDVYDAFRSRRLYRPALSHAAALQVMREASPGRFDPQLMQALEQCDKQFERIFREMPD